MKWRLIIVLLVCVYACAAQQTGEEDALAEQESETFREAEEEDTEQEDDYFLVRLAEYRSHPLNINDASENDLLEFPLLNPLLVNHLSRYRELLGKFISIYELQAVPGFTIEIIKKILPYITTLSTESLADNLKTRLRSGTQSILIRSSYVPERSKGFRHDDTTAGSYFLGSRARIFTRYKYQYKNIFQFGFLGDKDAGERFIKDKRQVGFDFYSFHFFLRKWRWIKSLAIGDFSVNLGQGLIHWQSQAFKKSAGVINIKRQGESLRPYHSAGEYNFHRGIAVNLEKKNWEWLLFVSERKISANISSEASDFDGPVASSFQISGLHRTATELEDKGSLKMLALGGQLKYQTRDWRLAFNGVRLQYALPIQKRDEPYNLFAMKGKTWSNYSVDYSYTFHNLHLFGEFAVDRNNQAAGVQGLMASLDQSVDIALAYRWIGKAYQSIYGNAFTENTMPSNEKGIYMALSARLFQGWKLDAYADFFSFPWLKYRVDAPAYGKQYLLQLSWKPDKKTELYSRFRFKSKPLNEPTATTVNIVEDFAATNWRTHVSFQASRTLLLRKRMEFCWFRKTGQQEQQKGFLMYTDVVFKPLNSFFSTSVRLQYFETGGYDTRLYAYENDVLFSSSIPAFFDNGVRYYVNFKSHFRLKPLRNSLIEADLKLGQTRFSNKTLIGSGLDEVNGNTKSEIKIQLVLNLQ